MKSAIICEGTTDLTLIQYFLEKVYNWEFIKNSDCKKTDTKIINNFAEAQNSKWFKHTNGSLLCIISAGGVSKIPNMLEKVLELNKLGSIDKYKRIVIISDRDEVNLEQEIFKLIDAKFIEGNISLGKTSENNVWNKMTYIDDLQEDGVLCFLPLIIPFEDAGAIETFLLNALCEASEKDDPLKIDKHVIGECITFIDSLDCNDKYLRHRREKTKAKFDTSFAVMTPAEAFSQRQTLLRSVPWEQYETIQNGFKQLSKLLEEL